jgi:FtsP/CotA-like multicopper oxidase with cupredoxin domain
MSPQPRRGVVRNSSGFVRWTLLAAAAAIAVCGAVMASVRVGNGEVREIHLVVRDMTYMDASTGEANPTLRLRRGQRVRLVLTNEDEGYTHNFVAPAMGISMPLLTTGKTQTLEFIVPEDASASTYSCGPHAAMMRGNIAIE